MYPCKGWPVLNKRAGELFFSMLPVPSHSPVGARRLRAANDLHPSPPVCSIEDLLSPRSFVTTVDLNPLQTSRWDSTQLAGDRPESQTGDVTEVIRGKAGILTLDCLIPNFAAVL